jgi:hypothetical protein
VGKLFGPPPPNWGAGDFVKCVDVADLDPYFSGRLALGRVYRVEKFTTGAVELYHVEGGFFSRRFCRAAINDTRAGRALARAKE